MKSSSRSQLCCYLYCIAIVESHSNMPPKIITTSRYIVGIVGETIELPCATQAFPRPHFLWFKINSNSKALQLISASLSSKTLQIDGSLIIKQVNVEDSAKYVCICNNSIGEDRLEVELLVRGKI